MSDTNKKIRLNIERLLVEIPPAVTIVAVCKTRNVIEVNAAYEAGLRHFGHNYVQEAQAMFSQSSFNAEWHLIGHLQRNKAEDAVKLFNSIDSVDSIRLVQELEKRCSQQEKMLPVLIEVNSGREENKSGAYPEQVDELAALISYQPHLRLEGLMTMGPRSGDPEESRPFFVEARRLFERLASQNLANCTMRYLSMGMSNNYSVAIQEGANMIRLGTAIFGESQNPGKN
jgi:pyridoxal phosphate enzyme (YggS family)